MGVEEPDGGLQTGPLQNGLCKSGPLRCIHDRLYQAVCADVCLLEQDGQPFRRVIFCGVTALQQVAEDGLLGGIIGVSVSPVEPAAPQSSQQIAEMSGSLQPSDGLTVAGQGRGKLSSLLLDGDNAVNRLLDNGVGPGILCSQLPAGGILRERQLSHFSWHIRPGVQQKRHKNILGYEPFIQCTEKVFRAETSVYRIASQVFQTVL